MAQEAGFHRLYSFTQGEEFVEVQGSIVLRESLFHSDPVLVEKFVRGTLKGLLYLKENRPGSIAVHARVLKIDEVTASRIYDLARPGTTVDGTVTEELQKKSIDQILERTDIKEPPVPKNVFDFSITRKIFTELQASGWKPGTSTKVTMGTLKASQVRMKRAPFSELVTFRDPARIFGWLAMTPTLCPPSRAKPQMMLGA